MQVFFLDLLITLKFETNKSGKFVYNDNNFKAAGDFFSFNDDIVKDTKPVKTTNCFGDIGRGERGTDVNR